MEALALCMLARVTHCMGDLSSAQKLYARSYEAEKSPLAGYGLAQMLIEEVGLLSWYLSETQRNWSPRALPLWLELSGTFVDSSCLLKPDFEPS
jgi:hypothetical protein